MNQLDFSQYNNLPLVEVADALFNKQLAAAHTTRDKFFAQLAPLFLQNGNSGKYAPCLIHRHYLLQQGERMVTNGASAQPSKNTSDNIVAECWLRTGEAVEYRVITGTDSVTLPPPPSKDFFDSFKKITDLYGVDMLGVCYLPTVDELKDGFVFLETAGSRDREQVTSIISESEIANSSQIYQTVWFPILDSMRGIGVVRPIVNCVKCGPGGNDT